MRIAVVGSGIAGLAAAHTLGPDHDVVLFESSDRLGGHANTVTVTDPDVGEIGVDTGFIVHNDRNYPNLVRLFEELDVPVRDSEMSFAVVDRSPGSPTEGFAYRATNLDTLFADRRNLLNRSMWRMLADIARFYRHANRFLESPDESLTLAGFLERHRYSREFVQLHLLPMGAAVWSADPRTFDRFPAASLLRFLGNHGLLGIGNRPQWRTVVGGSRVYVERLAARFTSRSVGGEVRCSTAVERVSRTDDGRVRIDTPAGSDTFDHVVLACHSDQALQMLAEPTPAEIEILGDIGYQPNIATLHTDTSVLADNRRAQAAWNYERRSADQRSATLTYDMTLLQGLPGSRRYLVSLNSADAIDPDTVLGTFAYTHPMFDAGAVAAQARHAEIDGVDRVSYCGAYWRYGFHEDGIASALASCGRLEHRRARSQAVPA